VHSIQRRLVAISRQPNRRAIVSEISAQVRTKVFQQRFGLVVFLRLSLHLHGVLTGFAEFSQSRLLIVPQRINARRDIIRAIRLAKVNPRGPAVCKYFVAEKASPLFSFTHRGSPARLSPVCFLNETLLLASLHPKLNVFQASKWL
jgi:hypothetical protein